MGAYTFTTEAEGASVTEAFKRARDAAAWEHGHGGYTGTIAEKDEVVVVEATPMNDERARQLAEELIDEGDPRIDDKWGPAGAIRLGDLSDRVQRWLFFGWASS